MIHIKTLNDLHKICDIKPPEHPLLSLFSFTEPPTIFPSEFTAYTGDFYQISIKTLREGSISYGRTKYDHSKGCMSFIKPRQKVELNNLVFEENGFFISIHENYLINNPIMREIDEYGYFEYSMNESLHCSPSEEKVIWDIYKKIEPEYYNNQDEMSKSIILSHIDSILKYAQRFYNRQFIGREVVSCQIESKFHKELINYFESDLPSKIGLPSVSFISEKIHLSPRYLSDLLKKQTGKTAIEHIHLFIISKAKNLLLNENLNISETAHNLGFEHTPYFSRLFKKMEGLTPKSFIAKFNSN